ATRDHSDPGRDTTDHQRKRFFFFKQKTAYELARFATEATGALAGLLWRRSTEGERLELVASAGMVLPDDALQPVAASAERALLGRRPVGVEAIADLPGLPTLCATLQLGQPSIG